MDFEDIEVFSDYEIERNGLKYLLFLDKGIQRIKSVASWPNGILPDKIQKVFPKFCEYIAFNMGTLYPFFEIIDFFVPVDRLFASLCKTNFQREKLSYDEAFEFLLSFPDDCHSFLDSYGKMSSYSHKMILCSLEERDFSKFSIALDNEDYSDFLCKLSILKYIITGKTKNQFSNWYARDKIWTVNNEWLNFCNWGVYFLNYEVEAEFVYEMIDQIIRRIIGIEKIDTYLDNTTPGNLYCWEEHTDYSDLLESLDNAQLIEKDKCYYEDWYNEWSQLLQNRVACSNKIAELTDDFDNFLHTCKSMSCEIMETPILTHPQECEQFIRTNYLKFRTLDKYIWGGVNPDDINQDSIKEIDEYTYSFSTLDGMTTSSCYTPISHNYVSKVEEFLAENKIERWKDLYKNSRFRDDYFGDYILLMIYRIAEVYYYMTEYLEGNLVESKLLNYIINKSTYKDIILNFVQNFSTDIEKTDGVNPFEKNEPIVKVSKVLLSDRSQLDNEVKEEDAMNIRSPKTSGCWLLKGTEAEMISWKTIFNNSFHNDLNKRVGQFVFPEEITNRQTTVYVSRICVALFYKAAEQVELAKPFLETPGLGASIERTFKPIVTKYRRQEMGKYMEMLNVFEKMEDCKKRNSFNRGMRYYEDGFNPNKYTSSRMIEGDIAEDPRDLTMSLKENNPDLCYILLNNYDKIREILNILRTKIKKKMPK